jgi:hypothetical protein
MKRRYAVFAVVLAVSIFIGTQAVEAVDATSFSRYVPNTYMKTDGHIDLIDNPTQMEPIVLIQSPVEDQIFNVRKIEFNFTVTEGAQYESSQTKITKVEYVLDPVFDWNLMVFVGWIAVPIVSGTELTQSYSLALPNVTEGNHTLRVRATASQQPSPGSSVNWYGGAAVHFTVNSTLNITIIPSSTPKTSPTPAPSVPESSWLAVLPLLISLVSVAVAIKLRYRKTGSDPFPTASYLPPFI